MIVYKITNLVNGKIYIGQTTQLLKERWRQHTSKSGCRALWNAIKKYGKEQFSVEEIDSASSIEELNSKEIQHIEASKALSPRGYNLNTGGANCKLSQETRTLIGDIHRGKVLSPEHKRALITSRQGKTNSTEMRLKVSAKLKARPKALAHKESLGFSKSIPVMGFREATNQSWFFRNPKHASQHGFSYACIQKCIRGIQKQHKGFVWNQVQKEFEV